MYVLSIDPGTDKMGVALLYLDQDDSIEVVGTKVLKKIGATEEAIKEAGRLINAEWIRGKDLEWDDIIVIIEAPAARWYGRSNTTAILKLWWQVYFFLRYYKKKAMDVYAINSFDWNIKVHESGLKNQYSDAEKLELFKAIFPDFPIGRRKTSEWGSKDTRDASLMGVWFIKTCLIC